MTEGDETQLLAATNEHLSLLVVAPPGCGKTEHLALRALEIIPLLEPNQRILALTFTNRAKANLSERLQRVLGRDRFRRYVTVRNFHGHAAEVVRAHGATMGLNLGDLKMPTTKTLSKALKSISNDSSANRAASESLAVLKRSPLSDEELLAALDGPGDELARKVEVDRIEANQLHYEDLLRHAQRLLAIDQIANLYHQHYGAVLVDEFQDLSPQQLTIALASCDKSRTFVGDPLQGIYSWAGANPAEVEAKLRGLCGIPMQLTVSYRSSPAVLAMVNGVIDRFGAMPLSAFDPKCWPDGGASAAVSLRTTADEAVFIAALSKQIVDADPSACVGVITRSGWRRGEIDKVFATMPDVPCRRWDLAIEDPAILDRLRSALSAMPRSVSYAAARDRVLATVDSADVDTVEQIEDAFEQLAAVSGKPVREALQQFSEQADDSVIAPGVHLLNAHTGKGQQFDWVFIPGLEEKHLPDRRSTKGEALAEEERVLLVMLSRAKHGVVVTHASELSGPYGSYKSIRSRWWDGLKATATMDWPTLEAHIDKWYPSQ